MKYIQVFILLFFTLLAACVPKPTPIASDKSSVCSDTSPVVFVDKTNAKPYGIVTSEKYVYWVDVKKEQGKAFAVLNQTPIVQPENISVLATIPLGDDRDISNPDKAGGAQVLGLAVDEHDGIAVLSVSNAESEIYILKLQQSGQWSYETVPFLSRDNNTGDFSGVAYHDGVAYFIQYNGQRGLYKLNLGSTSAFAQKVPLDFATNVVNRQQGNNAPTPPRLGGLEVVGDYLYFTDPFPFLPPAYKDEWLFRIPLNGGAVELVAMSDAGMDSDRSAVLIDYYDGVFYTGSQGDDLYYWVDNMNVKLTPLLSIEKPQFFGVAANSTHLFFTSFNNQKIYKICKPKCSKPNLVSQNVSINFEEKTVSVTVKNIGDERAGEHLTYIEINSTNATDRDKPQSQFTLDVPALDPGESKVYGNISFDSFSSDRGLNISSLNSANLVVHVDAKDMVAECNESDNLYDQSTVYGGVSRIPETIIGDPRGDGIIIVGDHGGLLPLRKICQYVKNCPGCSFGLCPGFTMDFEKVSGFDIQVVNSSGKVMSKAYGKTDTKTLQIQSHKISSNKKQQFSGSDLVVQFNPRKGTKSGSHQVNIEISQKQFKRELK